MGVVGVTCVGVFLRFLFLLGRCTLQERPWESLFRQHDLAPLFLGHFRVFLVGELVFWINQREPSWPRLAIWTMQPKVGILCFEPIHQFISQQDLDLAVVKQ